MRKFINGLAVPAEQAMDGEPISGDLIACGNPQRGRINVLYRNTTDFAFG